MIFKKSALIGLLLRTLVLIISLNVLNYDLLSYRIVGEITLVGKSIYPEVALFRFPYVPLFLYLQAFATVFRPLDIVILKLIIIAFDVGIIILLSEGFKKKTAALFYAVCPVPILIAAFHGQFDSIPLFFLLLAILLIKKKNIEWSTLVYSFAIALKTWPLFFIVPLVRSIQINDVMLSVSEAPRRSVRSSPRQRRVRMTKEIVSFIVLAGLVPFLSVCLYSYFFRTNFFDIINVIRTYQPVFGVYGIGLILKSVFGRSDLYFIGMAEKIFLLSLFIFSFLQRKKTIEENILGIILYLFVFTPVFGIQWLLWTVPFMLIVKPKGTLTLLALISTFLVFNYLSWTLYVSDFVLLGGGIAVWFGFIYAFIRYVFPISVSSKPPSVANSTR